MLRLPLWHATVVCALLCGLHVTGCGSDATHSEWSIDDELPESSDDAPPEPLVNCDGTLPELSLMNEDGGDTLRHSLEVDAGGCPHVTFTQSTEERTMELRYARWDGESWQMELIAEADLGSYENDVAIDDRLRPSVSYAANGGETLMYARRDDAGQWHSETVADVKTWYSDHAIAPDGRPVIAAVVSAERYTLVQPKLLFFYRDSNQWHREDVFTEGRNHQLSQPIVFDDQGRPHLVIVDNAERAVYAYRKGNDDWQIEYIEFTERVWHVFLTLDHSDQPHLIGCGIDSGVDYIYRRDGAWHQEPVADIGDSGFYCGGLAVDANNRLHSLFGPSSVDRRYRDEVFHATFDGDAGWTQTSLGESLRGPFVLNPRSGVMHIVATQDTTPPDWTDGPTRRTAVYFTIALDGGSGAEAPSL